MLSILKNLRAEEARISELLALAVNQYGEDHVDMITEVSENNVPTLCLMYHSQHNSFGIESNLPLTNVRLSVLKALETLHHIGLDTEALEMAEISLAD